MGTITGIPFTTRRTIEERGLIKLGGAIFFHDVCWPYGRRDVYYQPALIPKNFLILTSGKAIVREQSELLRRRERVNCPPQNKRHNQ
jgi:hypothetical protein